MAKKENNWIAWAALAIALVALISVLGNAYLTGNFIRVQKSQIGPVVYTKADIDKKFSSCISIGASSQGNTTGNGACKVNGKPYCLFGLESSRIETPSVPSGFVNYVNFLSCDKPFYSFRQPDDSGYSDFSFVCC